MNTHWYLYLIECRNGAFYAGITNDLERRYAQHVAGRGARYTRANPPLRLVGSRAYPDRSAAARAEYAIRQLPKSAKPSFLRQTAGKPPGTRQACGGPGSTAVDAGLVDIDFDKRAI